MVFGARERIYSPTDVAFGITYLLCLYSNPKTEFHFWLPKNATVKINVYKGQ